MTELNTNDYKKILEYYKEKIPWSARLVKINAEKIEIAHFLELEGGDDIIQYINI